MKEQKKSILVIGAGDNLGSAIARRFAREGYHAVGTRRRGDLSNFKSSIEAIGGMATGIHSDARDEQAVIDLIEHVENEIAPIEVFVFNVGGNVRVPLLETSAQVYRKVWEMCAFAGFLSGREVARRMLPRQRGTVLFTGATASVRGAEGFSAFAGGKHALRALAQSMAREFGPEGVHVAHVIIDGVIDTEATRAQFPEWFENVPDDGVLLPDDIADVYWHLHCQPRTAWTFETDVRPYVEKW